MDNLCALLQIDPHHTIELMLSFCHTVQNQKRKIKECVELIKNQEQGEIKNEFQILHNIFIDIIISVDDELIDDDMYIE
jgi:hypothetical protein